MLFPFQEDKIVTMTVLYDTESVLQSSLMIGSKRDIFHRHLYRFQYGKE